MAAGVTIANGRWVYYRAWVEAAVREIAAPGGMEIRIELGARALIKTDTFSLN